MNSQEYHIVPALGMRFLTPLYDTVVRWTTRERRFKTALIAQCGIQAGHRVLDLACGTGTLAIWAKQAHPNAEITGIDGDPAILEMARRKARSSGVAVGFHHGLSHRYLVLTPASTGSYPALLHHLSWQDKERTAPELLRVLEPGGEPTRRGLGSAFARIDASTAPPGAVLGWIFQHERQRSGETRSSV